MGFSFKILLRKKANSEIDESHIVCRIIINRIVKLKSMHIIEVTNKQTQKLFHQIPHLIYINDINCKKYNKRLCNEVISIYICNILYNVYYFFFPHTIINIKRYIGVMLILGWRKLRLVPTTQKVSYKLLIVLKHSPTQTTNHLLHPMKQTTKHLLYTTQRQMHSIHATQPTIFWNFIYNLSR